MQEIEPQEEKIRLAPPPTFWNSWPARIGSVLFVFLFLSGLFTYATNSWTPFYQLNILAHTFLGIPFIFLFFYYIVQHLIKAFGTARPIWIFLILSAVTFALTPTGPYISRTLHIPRLDILAFFLLPVVFIWYVFRLNRRLPLPKDRVVLFFGFLTLFFIATLSVSGPLFMMGSFCYPGGYPYIYAHQWTGVGIAATLGLHMAYQFRMLKRRRMGREAAVRGRWIDGKPLILGGGTAAIFLALAVAASRYEPPVFNNTVPEGYSRKFKDSLFLPAQTKTDGDALIDPRLVGRSASCGVDGCHIEIYQQWQVSSHGLAGMTHVAALEEMYASKFGIETARFCAGCHAPASLVAGEFDRTAWRPGELMESDLHREGVTCLVCHSMTEAEETGNGSFTAAPRKFYMYEFSGDPRKQRLNELLIKVKPKLHKEQFNRTLYKYSRACAPCHVQFLDEAFSEHTHIRTQDHYGQWKKSPYFVSEEEMKKAKTNFKPGYGPSGDPTKVPLKSRVDPYYQANTGIKGLTCQNCHMAFLRRNYFDDYYADHRFLGANNAASYLADLNGVSAAGSGKGYGTPGARGNLFLQDLDAETERWVRGEIDIPAIQSRWAEGPVLTMVLDVPKTAAPGDRIKVRIVTTNDKAGHHFPSGPMDLLEPWLELIVENEHAGAIYRSGFLDEKGYLEPDARVLRKRELDEDGRQIERHELWRVVKLGEDRTIPPKGSLTDEWEVAIPGDVLGPVKVTGIWKYRKAQQHIVDALHSLNLLTDVPTFPVMELNRVEGNIEIRGREK